MRRRTYRASSLTCRVPDWIWRARADALIDWDGMKPLIDEAEVEVALGLTLSHEDVWAHMDQYMAAMRSGDQYAVDAVRRAGERKALANALNSSEN